MQGFELQTKLEGQNNAFFSDFLLIHDKLNVWRTREKSEPQMGY